MGKSHIINQQQKHIMEHAKCCEYCVLDKECSNQDNDDVENCEYYQKQKTP